MKRKRLTHKLLPAIFAAVLALGLAPGLAFATGESSSPTAVDLSKGSYTIEASGNYTVSGYTGSNTLTIKAEAEVTLDGVNITAEDGESAISIASGNVVTLTVNSSSTLKGGKGGAGIYVAEGASVTIQGGATLTAIGNGGVDTSDSGAAGIGGTSDNGNSGAITIDGAGVVAKGYGKYGSGIGSGNGKVVGEISIVNNANVTAYGGYYENGKGAELQTSYGKDDPEGGAGIGGGGKTCSIIADITIEDSTVTAYGGSKAAGIGANFWSSCGKITITDSNVTAQGGSSSAGIGTSRVNDSNNSYVSGGEATIIIEGGAVTATGGAYGAGIGGGYNAGSLGNGADESALPEIAITISGGTVKATGGEGGAGIGGGYKSDHVSIDIAGSTITAKAGALVSGKTVEAGGAACAIGSGANGSGTFENGTTVAISTSATVSATAWSGGKAAIEGVGDGTSAGYLAAGYEVLENENGTYTVVEWDGVIENEADLWLFAAAANAGNNFSGKTIELKADIDLNGQTWTPVKSFAGNFLGNGHTISNFHIDDTAASGGFFKVIEASDGLEDVKVKDLILSDITATVGGTNSDGYRFGALASSVRGVVHNVTVKDVEVTTTTSNAWVAGMTAFMYWPWMTNCAVENLTVNAQAGADFICGFACILQKNSNHVFDNLDVNGFSVVVDDSVDGCGVAGFVGQTQRGWEYPKVINCDIKGIDITAMGLVDAAGFIAWPGAHTTAENCTTQGKIDVSGVTSDDCFAGGFFGNLGWNHDYGQMGHVVTDCSADVDIITKIAPAGGFVGSATNSNNCSMYATFENCSASGDITSTGDAPVGGFAGDADRGVFKNCSASGAVNGESYAGGFIGHVVDVTPKYDGRYPADTREYGVDEITIANCAGSSSVVGAEGKTAGIVGFIDENTDVTLGGNTYSIDPEYNLTDASVTELVALVVETGEMYSSLQEALAACTNGETVKLLSDITYGDDDITYASIGVTGYENYAQYSPSIIVVGGEKGDTPAENQPSSVNAIIDLNGHSVTNNAEAHLFFLGDNAKVTFMDSGDGAGIIGNTEWPVIWVMGTDTLATIESGKYTTANDEGLMWSTHAGDLVINGGDFSTTAEDASLLVVRNSRVFNNPNYFLSGQATVTVAGGAFHGFNPEKMYDDSTTPYTEFNAVVTGYKAVELEENVWQVVPVTCTVTFESNGGSSVASATVDGGSNVAEPAAPTRDGYTFAGWYLDEGLTQAYDFSAPVTGDITLYAKWVEEGSGTPSTGGDPDDPSDSDNDGDNSGDEPKKPTAIGQTGDSVPFAAAAAVIGAMVAALVAVLAGRKLIAKS